MIHTSSFIALINTVSLYPKLAAPKEKLDPETGAVSPFGLLNDAEHAVHFYWDKRFAKNGGIIGIHPNDNTATVWLKADDSVKRIEDAGNSARLVSI